MRQFLHSLLLLAWMAGSLSGAEIFSLAGDWRFRLEHNDPAHAIRSGDTVFRPGSTDQAGYGNKTSGPERGWLSRPYTIEGPAWYEREVVIPGTWRGKRIVLFLERAHRQTAVWVDGISFGSQDSLSTPHQYDLTRTLAPGTHRITLCVDNSYLVDVGRNTHSVTEHTQTNWNGVAGAIELRIGDPVWIDAVALYPDTARQVLRVEATVGNATGGTAAGRLRSGRVSASFTAAGAGQKVELSLPLPGKAWDEFHPSLFDLDLELTAAGAHDTWHTQYGVRQIGTRDRQFTVNGQPVFLRGTVECNIFPLTGYPPTDLAPWERIFRIARSYGLNHIRFHSNCPPEAAFVAGSRRNQGLQVADVRCRTGVLAVAEKVSVPFFLFFSTDMYAGWNPAPLRLAL